MKNLSSLVSKSFSSEARREDFIMAKGKTIDSKAVCAAEEGIRDLINWLAVFKTEYGIPKEAYKTLHQKADALATKIGAIACTPKGVDVNSVKTAANTLRDAKAWLAVFAKEYDIEKEAVKVLTEKFDQIGKKLAAVECK